MWEYEFLAFRNDEDCRDKIREMGENGWELVNFAQADNFPIPLEGRPPLDGWVFIFMRGIEIIEANEASLAEAA